MKNKLFILQVPHRLMTFQLISGVEVCVICGPTPSLSSLEREVSMMFFRQFNWGKFTKTFRE